MNILKEIDIYIKAHRLNHIITQIDKLNNNEKFIIAMNLLRDLNMKSEWKAKMPLKNKKRD